MLNPSTLVNQNLLEEINPNSDVQIFSLNQFGVFIVIQGFK
jgi:hypothetical protein